jgi:hypothetical protein
MKHAREDYNRIQDPAGLIPDDEPVFLLRAKDKTAPNIVREWARQHRQNGGAWDVCENAIGQAARMEAWQLEHGAQLADVPT